MFGADLVDPEGFVDVRLGSDPAQDHAEDGGVFDRLGGALGEVRESWVASAQEKSERWGQVSNVRHRNLSKQGGTHASPINATLLSTQVSSGA